MPAPTARPIYFGSPASPLFGFLHVPTTSVRGSVVLVPPWGYEAVCTHRSYRHLAERLAEAGFVVLRFDLHGTGDSAGSPRDPGEVPRFVDDIRVAVAEARARAGTDVAFVFGTRLGALLALAAAEGLSLAGIVMFAAVTSGRAYVREMKAFRLMAEEEEGGKASERGPDDEEEAAGYPLTAETRRALSKLDLRSCGEPPPRALVVSRDDLVGGDDSLVTALRARGVDVTADASPGYIGMMRDPHQTAVPDAVFSAITAWLVDAAPETGLAPPALPPPEAVTTMTSAAGAPVLEHALCFGPEGGQFAIVTEPTHDTRKRREAIVVMNAGAVHRIGPNRMWARMARDWAAAGYVVMRFDAPGLGDSRPRPGRDENLTYEVDPVPYIEDALAVLRERKKDRFVALGLCSGAFAAFHAALRAQGMSRVVLVNPQTFHWKEGQSLEVAKRKNDAAARYYGKVAFSGRSWKKALRGEVDLRNVAKVIVRKAGALAASRVVELVPALAPKREHDIAGELTAIAARKVSVLMVFSDADPGRDYVAGELGSRRTKRMMEAGVFSITIVDGADHTFTPVWSQDELGRRLEQHLLGP